MAIVLDNTPKKIEDGVRKAPANQGLNEYEMWVLIDAAIAAANTATTLNPVQDVLNKLTASGDRHGRK